jgi:hypothetical protein
MSKCCTSSVEWMDSIDPRMELRLNAAFRSFDPEMELSTKLLSHSWKVNYPIALYKPAPLGMPP